jgi:hypothetical protein
MHRPSAHRPILSKLIAGPLLASLGLVLSACNAVPTVTKERMTLGEANIDGMECRRDRPPDSSIPRTICASPAAWAAFDERRRLETDDILAEGRKAANVGRYNTN